jgi:mutual gliding-motility protein MglA
MSFVNFASREICCKIVYYGPGYAGKTQNLRHIHARTAEGAKGRLMSLETDGERTLFFDFLPIDLGSAGGYKTRFMLYTVPGQVFYNAVRRLVLKGVDGVVFVADSLPDREDANAESMESLRENLAEHLVEPARVPLVIQYNKRDRPEAEPVERLRALLNPGGAPEVEASALQGVGVFETLKVVGKRVLEDLRRAEARAVKGRACGSPRDDLSWGMRPSPPPARVDDDVLARRRG